MSVTVCIRNQQFIGNINLLIYENRFGLPNGGRPSDAMTLLINPGEFNAKKLPNIETVMASLSKRPYFLLWRLP
jgi:hypothetical protein